MENIFKGQFEDIVFSTFGSLIENSHDYRKVTNNEVAIFSIESEQFKTIWNRLISEFGSMLARKNVPDKICTFAHNNRPRLRQK